MTLVGCCCCTITCCPPSELVGMRVGRICFPDCCCCNCTPLEGVVFTRLGGPAVVVISVVPPSPCMLPTLLIGICWYISPPMLRSITPFWVSMMVLFFPDVGDTFRADTPLVPTAAVGCIRTWDNLGCCVAVVLATIVCCGCGCCCCNWACICCCWAAWEAGWMVTGRLGSCTFWMFRVVWPGETTAAEVATNGGGFDDTTAVACCGCAWRRGVITTLEEPDVFSKILVGVWPLPLGVVAW